MTNSQQVTDQTFTAGPRDNLAPVNSMTQDAIGLEVTSAILQQPNESTPGVDLSNASLGTSVRTTEETQLHPVKLSELAHYLYLACEHKWQRERVTEQAFAEKLAHELREPSTDNSRMAEPTLIQSLLTSFDLRAEDWQKASANSDLTDLLRAARSMKAARLNLPNDASESQINAEAALAANLQMCVNSVTAKIAEIRQHPEQHTGLYEKETIDLGRTRIQLGNYYSRLLESRLAKTCEISGAKINRRFWGCTLGGIAGTPLISIALAASLGTSLSWPDIVLSGCWGGMVGLGSFSYIGVPLITKQEQSKADIVRDFLGDNCSSPALEAAIKQLSKMGVKVNLALTGSILELHFFIPSAERDSQ